MGGEGGGDNRLTPTNLISSQTVYKGPGSNSLIFRIVKVNNKVERVKDIVDKEMGFVDEER